MTKMIKICDRCKKEVDWLYSFPMLNIAGLVLEQPTQSELCSKCVRDIINIIYKEVRHYDPPAENH